MAAANKPPPPLAIVIRSSAQLSFHHPSMQPPTNTNKSPPPDTQGLSFSGPVLKIPTITDRLLPDILATLADAAAKCTTAALKARLQQLLRRFPGIGVCVLSVRRRHFFSEHGQWSDRTVVL